MKKAVIAVALSVVVALLSANVHTVAHAQGDLVAPSNVVAQNTGNPGEVRISWDPVPNAAYYRIGWVAYSDVEPIIASDGDWLEHFAFIDIENRDQTEHTVTRLTPGVQYAFIMASNDGRYGTPRWPTATGWAFLTLNEAPATHASLGSTAVNLTWNAVPGAEYYRVGWVVYEDVAPIIASGGDWLEHFAFIDITNRGQTEHTITRLTPGLLYAFIVAGNDGRYGTPQWPPASAWQFMTPSVVQPTGPDSDRAALIALYNATGGANWTNRTNWLSNSPISDWRGVTTNDDGRVTAISLEENGLKGQLPAALGDLSELTNLTLTKNELSGPIPDSLSRLSRLQRLDLGRNRLTGPLPSWLGNLSELTNLTLYNNDLRGPIPDSLSRLSRLRWLDVGGNELTGPVPSWLGNLSELTYLSLWGNDFDSSIPASLGNLTNLTILDIRDNRLTGAISSQLGNLSNLRILRLENNQLTGDVPGWLVNLTRLEWLNLSGNALTGCVPAALQNVADNDLDRLGLPDCGKPQAREFSTRQLETLFDEIISKTERREAFSEVKERNIGFSAIEDMKSLRAEFVASRTETELYYALWKLSNARRDVHLRLWPVDGGLQPPRQASCVSAPLHVLPDYSDIDNPTFFVAGVGAGLASPKVGDVIVGVNGRSMAEYVNEFTPWIRHSTLYGLYWRMAHELPKQVSTVPPRLYSGQLDLTLENSSGQRYDVSLPYSGVCQHFDLMARYPGFDEVMKRENFNVLLDRSRQMILLQWLDFERNELIKDIPALMEYAEREQILDYDMIIDVSWSGGGSGGAYAIQRLVDQPFRVTFGNVRLSDLGKARIERYVGREPYTDAQDIFGLNLSRSWLIDWARTDATEAIRRGDEYTPSVPFKLAHLPKDSDGILQPAPVHFSGEVAIINARTWGGSHLDQFMAMYVDNDLATFIGMPTGGYSNTWEGDEVLVLPETGRPLVRFMWSIGHTIRPNGDVLEGNPAQPDNYIPVTRDNFQGYHQMLLDTALTMAGGAAVTSGSTDRDALISLYNATGRANWTNGSGWLSNAPIGQWHGVTTNDDGRVIRLDLRENGLTGPIPSNLGNLSNLVDLRLHHNQLTGPIPTTLGNLSNLEGLRLQENQLTGTIPAWVGNLTRLEELNLSGNRFAPGAIPSTLANLSSLRELYLWESNLNGPIPSWLGNLANLEVLNLGGNQFTPGPIPSTFASLSNLTALYLWECQLTGTIPPELGNLSRLTKLHLHGNELGRSVPASLGGLSNLEELGLGGNQFTGPIPASLGGLSTLTGLYLWENQFTGPLPAQLSNLTRLTALNLSDNRLHGPVPDWLGDLTNLETLGLGGNELTGVIPSELGNLRNLKRLSLRENQLIGPVASAFPELLNLEYLSLRDNQLSGPVPMELQRLTALTHLDLHGNELSGPLPPELGNLTNLQRLYLHENQITGPIPIAFGGLINLEQLDLNENQLTGEIPFNLGYLSKLTYLNLDFNELTGEVPDSLGGLEALEHLDISNNQLEGTIPPELGLFRYLTYLDLDSNRFTGEMPARLGSLANLTHLDVKNNEIEGPIPIWLGHLAELTFLDFANNQFTGQIPGVLGNLTKLETLKLNRNLLMGRIPFELTSLTNLEQLELSDNGFTGCIPAALFNVAENDLNALELQTCQ